MGHDPMGFLYQVHDAHLCQGQVLVDLVVEFVESLLEERMEKQDMDGKSVGLVSL